MSHPPIDDAIAKSDLSDIAPQPPSCAARLAVATTVRIGLVIAATFAVGFAGGYVARLLHFPLPYMTGALLVTAGLGLAGVPVRSLWHARLAGQFVTGAAIGTAFTAALLAHLVLLLPLIVAASAVSIAIGGIGALMLMRMAHLDHKTAFLAAMPGGVIEMANVAARIGADPLPIMVLQTMRVGLTVCAAPFIATVAVDAGTHHAVAQAEVMSWATVAWLMVASLAGGLLLWSIRLPNCWFLGAIGAVSIVNAFGLVEGRVPDVILVLAQVTIGTSIGTQYRHEFLTRLLRLLLSSLVTVPFALVMTGLIGTLLAIALALPIPTMFLALAPAGIAEMALTGKVLGLDAALITGFQVVRILMVTLGAAPASRLFERLTAPRT